MEKTFRIREIMEEKKISSVELASAIGVTPQFLSEVLSERRNLSMARLRAIADFLGVPVIALFQGYVQMNQVTDNSQVICPCCGHILALVKVK